MNPTTSNPDSVTILRIPTDRITDFAQSRGLVANSASRKEALDALKISDHISVGNAISTLGEDFLNVVPADFENLLY